MSKINKLLEYQKKITDVEYTVNILNWELAVSTPKKGSDDLINLITVYEDMLFTLETDKKYGNLLKDAIASKEFLKLPEAEQRYIKIKLRRFEENSKIPKDFYIKYVSLKNKTNIIWKEAKEKNDYKLYKPYLKKIIDMTKKYYRYLDKTTKDLYDVMLNHYETSVTSGEITTWFNELKEALMPLIPKEKKEVKEYTKNYSESELKECAKYLLNYIGFDLDRGVIGVSHHAFTEKININDVRITFKYSDKPIDFCSTIIHEGGHGIFEQNISPNLSRYENTCVENLNALHESQSRFYENILGRNKNFWIPIYDDIKNLLKLDLSIDEFVKYLNNPVPSLIRTEADELTYCMHIIIRYEIERDLFNGLIKVDDLPKIWNKKMQEYLGVKVKNDSDGLMQDVHWAGGEFGYFPSYLIGNIYDGMFIEAIENDVGSIDNLLKEGKINKITEYLVDNIYKNGGAYQSREIIEKMCDKKISTKPIIKYFYKKYNKESK